MDTTCTPGPSSHPHSWLGRVAHRLKPKSRTQIVGDGNTRDAARKLHKHAPAPVPSPDRQEGVNELGENTYSIFSEASTLVESRHVVDHTELMHGLADFDNVDSLVDGPLEVDELRRIKIIQRSEKHERMIESLPSSVWNLIATCLDPADAAHLAIANKTLHEKLGNEPFQVLARPENLHHRIRFLNHMDAELPGHLLCFPCGQYHIRTNKGNEKFKADYVKNPVYLCPKVFISKLPRIRLAHGRELPYSFIQLAIRHAIYSSEHGVEAQLMNRRWSYAQSGWTYQSAYMVVDGRLLVRVRSQTFADPKLTETSQRKLLYEKDEYLPYFSVCAHWRDGDLMRICKCALSHIPSPPQSYLKQLSKSPIVSKQEGAIGYIARMCDECRPARRCPECPTEYLLEVNMAEDKTDPVRRFKHALVVTRWSDLGDGTSPSASPEYCAVNGTKADYDSFTSIGRRAVAGVFESKMSGVIPGQRMISLNPTNVKQGEAGHGWY